MLIILDDILQECRYIYQYINLMASKFTSLETQKKTEQTELGGSLINFQLKYCLNSKFSKGISFSYFINMDISLDKKLISSEFLICINLVRWPLSKINSSECL